MQAKSTGVPLGSNTPRKCCRQNHSPLFSSPTSSVFGGFWRRNVSDKCLFWKAFFLPMKSRVGCPQFYSRSHSRTCHTSLRGLGQGPQRRYCARRLSGASSASPSSEGALPNAASITLPASLASSSGLERLKNDSSHLHLPPERCILPGGAGPFQSNTLLRLTQAVPELILN